MVARTGRRKMQRERERERTEVQNRFKIQKKAIKPMYLAESVSKSGTGNTCSDDDNVGVTVDGSAFSVGGWRAYDTLAPRRGIGSSSTIPPRRDEERECNGKAEDGGQDPAKGAVINHCFLVPENVKSQQPHEDHRSGDDDDDDERLSVSLEDSVKGSENWGRGDDFIECVWWKGSHIIHWCRPVSLNEQSHRI